MADTSKSSDGPEPFDKKAWDAHELPDFDDDFIGQEDIDAFAEALNAPDIAPSEEDLLNPSRSPTEFITALNDWKPIRQRVKGRQGSVPKKSGKKKKKPRRGKDETREGWTYSAVKWPLLLLVGAWLLGEGLAYLFTRTYIYLYEQMVSCRGTSQRLRREMRSRTNYHDWMVSAKQLDDYLDGDKWREQDEYAYYDARSIKKVIGQLRRARHKVESISGSQNGASAIDELRTIVEGCVKNNFAGYENPRLYSETYYGTKNLVQAYVDEASLALKTLFDSEHLDVDEKRSLSKHLSTNFGRTALCLSGGATFAYYHLGIAKALLDADLLPSIITGTSGGALIAGLLCTRTNEELKALLVPALAARITACQGSFFVWFKRWYATGARFDSVDWAMKCAWFCRGSLTFAEAYARTGRILNVTCVPSDPHTPTILANHLTAPDCVVWSAVLASAAVPGVLNPVVLMRKRKDGSLEPYSFGHKWKDGSLRTDVPLKSLNLHFNVNFSIVSQVNPHINLFFFSSRGTVGRPVTHRRGRGWRGGFLGSALEQYLKLDLTKWLKVLRHLELLPRWMGQDWSEVWLQRFSGTITIWPKTLVSDFYYILTDPTMHRLARMIQVGQQAAFPKLNFIGNRIKIERIIDEARRSARAHPAALPTPGLQTAGLKNVYSEEDLQALLAKARSNGGSLEIDTTDPLSTNTLSHRTNKSRSSDQREKDGGSPHSAVRQKDVEPENTSLTLKLSNWFSGGSSPKMGNFKGSHGDSNVPGLLRSSSDISGRQTTASPARGVHRASSVIDEIGRQSRVFIDDSDTEADAEDTADETASGGISEGSVTADERDTSDEFEESLEQVH